MCNDTCLANFFTFFSTALVAHELGSIFENVSLITLPTHYIRFWQPIIFWEKPKVIRNKRHKTLRRSVQGS